MPTMTLVRFARSHGWACCACIPSAVVNTKGVRGLSTGAKWLLARELLQGCDSPSLCDADKTLASGVIDYAIRPSRLDCEPFCLWPPSPEKSLMESSPGEVLVVDCGGSKVSVAGELFSAEAKRRSLAGMLIEGSCRDTETIAKLRFPVYCRFVNPMAGLCLTLERDKMQIPITIGGVEVRPGDVIFGDDDGVVVLGNDLDKIRELAIRAGEIKKHERAVLKEVLDNDRCLLEFMNLMDRHKRGPRQG